MDNSYRELYRTLDEEISLYKVLLAVMHKEQECILAADHEKLLETVSLVEQNVEAIKDVKRRRAAHMRAITTEAGASVDEPTLEGVIPLLPPRTASAVSDMLINLEGLIRNISRVNDENKTYVGDALSLYDEMIARLTGADVESQKTYTAPGVAAAARRPAASSLLVSKEV